MSQSKKFEKTPLSEEPVEGFAMTVAILAKQLGIDEIPSVYSYVELLQQACDRHIFEVTHNIAPEKELEKSKRTFITIFRARYLQFMDLEYESAVTGVDARMIRQTCKKLSEKTLDVSDFLGWVFERFLEDNPKFCPPTIKQICSGFVWQKFLYENKGKVRERQHEESVRKESLALVQRARVMIRVADDYGDDVFKEKVKNVLTDLRDKRTILNDFREQIESLETEQASIRKGIK